MKQAPTFPPLLKGHRVPEGKVPAARARAMVSKGQLGAGDIVWSEDTRTLRFALVLEPETQIVRCPEMLPLAMVAFGDAVGAICPPEVAITYRWPSDILMNGARIGKAGLELSDMLVEGVPEWMIVWLDADIKPADLHTDAGNMAEMTTMWDEGCGDISRTELLESTSRHLVNWIHTWSEDGFKPVHDQWMGRIDGKRKFAAGIPDQEEFLGLDEHGNALVKQEQNTRLVSLIEILKTQPPERQPG